MICPLLFLKRSIHTSVSCVNFKKKKKRERDGRKKGGKVGGNIKKDLSHLTITVACRTPFLDTPHYIKVLLYLFILLLLFCFYRDVTDI